MFHPSSPIRAAIEQWLARDDGTRLWLDPLTLPRAKAFAERALQTPRAESQVRNELLYVTSRNTKSF